MIKCKSGLTASKIARERGLCWGSSVFGKGYYVGTSEELKKIGVIDINTTPQDDVTS